MTTKSKIWHTTWYNQVDLSSHKTWQAKCGTCSVTVMHLGWSIVSTWLRIHWEGYHRAR